MLSQNQNPKELLAQGNLEAALQSLVRLSQHTDDADLRQRVLTLSGQLAALKKQQLTGLLEVTDYRLQLNRITAAVAEIVDSQQLSESLELSGSSQRWKKWAGILAILASIAGITGYTLRDFLWPKLVPIEKPAIDLPKKDTIVVTAPPEKPRVERPAAKPSKQTIITVKDSAKVGIINTGDSPVFNIKQ